MFCKLSTVFTVLFFVIFWLDDRLCSSLCHAIFIINHLKTHLHTKLMFVITNSDNTNVYSRKWRSHSPPASYFLQNSISWIVSSPSWRRIHTHMCACTHTYTHTHKCFLFFSKSILCSLYGSSIIYVAYSYWWIFRLLPLFCY